MDIGVLDLSALMVQNNTAYRYGGGVHLTNIGGSVTFRGITLAGNKALAGGGVSCSAILNITMTSDTNLPTVFENRTVEGSDRRTPVPTGANPTVIQNNTASVGGGMYYEPGHDILLIVTVRADDSDAVD